MHRVGAIILAAGLSRRMGARNKLLLPINSKPMVRQTVETYLEAIDGPICVVTGFEADKIEDALSGLPVRCVHNADFAAGQAFSVRAGLLEAPDAQNLLIGLGDQPALGAQDLRALVTAHLEGDPDKISIPVTATARGNPIVLPAAMRAALLADRTNPGCGKFTRTHPELVQFLPMSQRGFFEDIDTPEAFTAYNQRQSQRTMV